MEGWDEQLFGADGGGEHTQSTQGISKHNLRTGRPYLTRLDRSNALKLIPHQAGTKQSISFHAIILIAIGEYNDRNDNNKDHDDDGKTGGKTVMNCIYAYEYECEYIHYFCLQALTSNCRRLLHWRNAICHPSNKSSANWRKISHIPAIRQPPNAYLLDD